MDRSRVNSPQSVYFPTIFVVGLIVLFAPLTVHAQSPNVTSSASLQGVVRDAHGQPIGGANVYLYSKNDEQTLTVATDSEGKYHFAALHEGSYTLRAEKAGYDPGVFGACVFGAKETKKVDFTLKFLDYPGMQASSNGTPEFYDEPGFTVAGVTDTTNLGGHGSDTGMRTREGLAKEIVSLKDSASSSSPSPAITVAEESLRKTAEHEPESFDANYRLGKLLVDEGKAGEGISYLERASHLRLGDYKNAYELARAYAQALDYERALTQVHSLLIVQEKAGQDKADLHTLLGDVDEKLGKSLEAVQEYQRATELDPSEPNLFDWGAELLLHRALEPATEVFAKGKRFYPRSVRMLIGLGVSWYARGSAELAIQYLCLASDLEPSNATPYLFLGKIQNVEKAQTDAVTTRLGRFVALQPQNAMASYYYAISLWKGRKGPEDADTLAEVQSLLERSVHLDPELGVGYLQQGILYSERKDFSKAIAAYQKAIEVCPQLEEAHYRLGQTYRQAGEKSKAQEQLQLYEQISKSKAEDVERERREIQRFVYKLRDRTSAEKPQ
jgi:tetratricopeptide (TPR) repeat protein